MRLLWKNIAQPGEAFHLVRQRLKSRNRSSLHDHDFAEIFWVNEDEGRHLVNGHKESLQRGNLVFVRPSDYHAIEPKSRKGMDFTNIAFPVDSVEWLGERYFTGSRNYFWSCEDLPYARRISEGDLASLERRTALLASRQKSLFELEAFLVWLLHDICERGRADFSDTLPAWLSRALIDIEKREHFERGLDAFLELAGRTQEHVSRVTKKELGLTPSQIVNRTRLEFAAQQLQMTSKPILEICFECGFSNASYFYRRFGEMHGMSPSRYRLAQQKMPL